MLSTSIKWGFTQVSTKTTFIGKLYRPPRIFSPQYQDAIHMLPAIMVLVSLNTKNIYFLNLSSILHLDNYMYVFGGCTSTNTTFNDLWKLNLTTRSWVRPLPTGSYPSPKACATLVCYKDSLILYGGWTQSSSSPLHQVIYSKHVCGKKL